MSSSDKRASAVEAGRWLKEQRERRGITSQAELARLLGWDKSTVNNYETRGTTVPDDRAAQLAEVLGMDLIEVRRNLGLWVPDDGDRTAPATGAQIALAHELMAQGQRLSELAEQLLKNDQNGEHSGEHKTG